ncbi:hypothetical protein [Streptomyces sp. NPDC014685]|uniref:hypothetical protein n=1 Tax=Streptomyces sp. NPDC014685 TaxID=3364881 RepID=UPI0036F4E67E
MLLDEAAYAGRGDQEVGEEGRVDGADQLLGRHVLQQEATAAGAQGRVDELVFVEGGEDDDPWNRVETDGTGTAPSGSASVFSTNDRHPDVLE